jgi:hypothetical protein
MTPEDAKIMIGNKMKSDRPTLRQYLRSRASGEARSSQDWENESPGCAQAAYRNGASFAYRDIERMLARNGFSPE